MRDLAKSDKNKLLIQDGISGTEIELYYRMPNTQEMVAYQNQMVKKVGRKVVLNTFETRLKWGIEILTGFREGDFGFEGKPISSDEKSPNYREDWKKIIKEGAADIVSTLALTVFEGVRVDTGVSLELGEEEAPPF